MRCAADMPPRAAPEVRAAAIAMWMAGESPTHIASKLGIQRQRIYEWTVGYTRGGSLEALAGQVSVMPGQETKKERKTDV